VSESQPKAKILICEDEVIIATDLDGYLRSLGYTVCGTAASGPMALKLVERRQPDLVMMDIVLQGKMDGIDTAEIIRDKWGIPVIFLTAFADTNRLERAKLTYPFGFLLKPFNERDLQVTVEMSLYVAKVDAQRRSVETALRASEEKYRLLFTHAPTGIYEVNFTTGLFTRVNSLICDYTGYAEEELLNMGALSILTEESQLLFLERMERIGRGETLSANPEYCIKNKDGSTRWVQLNAEFIRQDNRIIGATVVANDISDRKRAEEAVRKSEAKYRNLVEKLDDIIWSIDLDFKYEYVSPSVEKALGFSQEERRKQTPVELLTPESFARAMEIFSQEIDRERDEKTDPNRTIRVEFEYYHKNGSTRWFENLISGLRNEKGVLVGIQGVSRDITERKRMEKKLMASENRYRKLVEHLPDIIFRFDRNCRYLYASPSAKMVFNTSSDEFVGKTNRELGFPESLCEYWENIIRKVFETEYAVHEEFEFIGADGKVYFDWRIVPEYGLDGKIESVLSISRDISIRKRTEYNLKRSERTLQKIFEILPVGLWFTDNTGKLISGNPKGVEIWGAEPLVGQEEYGVFKARRLPSKEEILPEDWALAHTINEGVTIQNELIEIEAFDGKTKKILNFTAPVKDDDGQMLGAVVVNQDITEFVRIEEGLRNSLKEKELLLKELNHRVKNNMQVIISLMNLQSKKFNDEKLKNAFFETKNRIYAMSAVHETLHQTENLTSVNLREYLPKLSKIIFHSYRTDAGQLIIKIDIPNIGVALEKSYPIGLIVNELMSNSLKYAFPEGRAGEIHITGERTGNTARLIVSDSGVGIPKDFDWRNTDSLGLRLVRSLVEIQLGGTIDLDTSHGTRWTITLPV
jgi:PAS domain S-box-containing protein